MRPSVERSCELIAEKGLWAVNYDQSVYLRTDACCERLGAYLFQVVERKEKNTKGKNVIAKEERVAEYWSRSVPAAMRDYDARRLELLAVILALEHFKPFIDGVRVQLDTDHRNLTFLKDITHSSGQLARWAMRLSEFNFELKYRPGKDMQIADCLSRNALPQELSKDELAAVMMCMNVAEIETDQENDSLFVVTWGQVT